MEPERRNAEIIYNAYIKYRECCEKKGSKMNPARVISYRAQTATQAERYCYYLESSNLLETERKNITDKARRLYKQYCMQCRYQSSVRDGRTDKKLERLMLSVAEYEAEIVASLEERSAQGTRYDVEAMMADDRYIRYLASHSMRSLIDLYLQEQGSRKDGSVSNPEVSYFATNTGSRYHRKGCRYVAGKALFSVSMEEIGERKLTPCRCIDSGEPEAEKQRTVKEQRGAMTVFIDESIRPNRLHEWNGKIPAETAMFSYIICRGFLNSEKQITDANRLESGIGLVTGNESKGVERVAMEAVNQVLLKIAGKFDFFGEVIIYTDNLSAKNQWPRKRIARKLCTMFQKVTVYHIDREENKAADRVGRQRSIIELPVELLDKLVQEIKEGKSYKNYQNRMRQYFPAGVVNVENLIEELEDLLQEITDKKGEKGRGNRCSGDTDEMG